MIHVIIPCENNKQNITCSFGDTKSFFLCWKIFPLVSALTHEIFSTQREISYLGAAMHFPLDTMQISEKVHISWVAEGKERIERDLLLLQYTVVG